MEKCFVDTQVHHKVYLASVGSNNKWKTDNKPNDVSWLEHININDKVHGLTLLLVWIEDALDCIINKFGNK